MLATVDASSAGWLFIIGITLLGCTLSPIAESIIAKRLPRLGRTPTPPIRITTAALTGLACAAFAWRFGFTFSLPAFLFLTVLGVHLARIDIELHLLPNPLVMTLLCGGLLLLLMPTLFNQQADDLLRAALGAAILFAGYLIMGLISPGGIGMGDVKLAAPVGLYLGYSGWNHLLYGGLLGFILNGLATVIILGRRGRNHTAEVAHGPSMLGALAAVTLLIR